MASSNNNEIISVVSPHTIKKFELIEAYVQAWAHKLLEYGRNTGSCNGIVFIDCIKFSVLIGSPDTCAVRVGEFFGICEYVWEWPSERYPGNYLIEAPRELIQTEYHSRFVKGLWVVPDKTEEQVAIAAIAAGKARFEYGEKPTV